MKQKKEKKIQTKRAKKRFYNIDMLYNVRKEVIKFYDDYPSMVSEAKIKATELKILTPKQMLQRLPIALAQVKAGNIAESLLSEIRQIVNSCINQKKSLKKSTIT